MTFPARRGDANLTWNKQALPSRALKPLRNSRPRDGCTALPSGEKRPSGVVRGFGFDSHAKSGSSPRSCRHVRRPPYRVILSSGALQERRPGLPSFPLLMDPNHKVSTETPPSLTPGGAPHFPIQHLSQSSNARRWVKSEFNTSQLVSYCSKLTFTSVPVTIQRTDIRRGKGGGSHIRGCMPQNLQLPSTARGRFKWRPTNVSSLDDDQVQDLLPPL